MAMAFGKVTEGYCLPRTDGEQPPSTITPLLSTRREGTRRSGYKAPRLTSGPTLFFFSHHGYRINQDLVSRGRSRAKDEDIPVMDRVLRSLQKPARVSASRLLLLREEGPEKRVRGVDGAQRFFLSFFLFFIIILVQSFRGYVSCGEKVLGSLARESIY